MIGFDAVDLFAGPGGWDIAARQLGLRVLGVEKDDAACQTRRAAGLPTLQADVSALNPLDFTGIPLLIASPPCQTFSSAGNGAGRRQLADIVTAIRDGSENDLEFTDGRTGLVLEPLRWALTARPAGVALEQVPAVLPIWEAIAGRLEQVGYTVATGLLHAEQYGVPQTRKRAVLVASRTDTVTLPAPTHRKYRKGVPQDAGEPGLLPWVSMSDALGWGMTGRPSMTVTAGGGGGPEELNHSATHPGMGWPVNSPPAGGLTMRSNYGTGGDSSNRGERTLAEPAATVTGKVGRNKWVWSTGTVG